MSYILGLDLSKYQGATIDFGQVAAAGYAFTIPLCSYSYPGQANRYSPAFSAQYYGSKAAGLVSGGYHKVGWTDPIAEADFFIQGMQPLVEGDLLAYDIEPASDVTIPANWSAWEQAFVQRIHDRTGAWPFRYMNISMYNSMPAEGVVTNCGPWVAAPSFGWNDTVPVSVTIMIQQGPEVHVPGITANVCDTDAFFGTRDELLKYGYHAPQPAPAPVTPVEPPQPAPAPQPVPTPTPAPEPPVAPPSAPPAPSTPPAPTVPTVDQPTKDAAPSSEGGWWIRLLGMLINILKRLGAGRI